MTDLQRKELEMGIIPKNTTLSHDEIQTWLSNAWKISDASTIKYREDLLQTIDAHRRRILYRPERTPVSTAMLEACQAFYDFCALRSLKQPIPEKIMSRVSAEPIELFDNPALPPPSSLCLLDCMCGEFGFTSINQPPGRNWVYAEFAFVFKKRDDGHHQCEFSYLTGEYDIEVGYGVRHLPGCIRNTLRFRSPSFLSRIPASECATLHKLVKCLTDEELSTAQTEVFHAFLKGHHLKNVEQPVIEESDD